jgi:hypothetical protein
MAFPSPAAIARGARHQLDLTVARRLDRRSRMQRRLADRALAAAARWSERDDPVPELHAAEASRWSQNGEDGLIAALLARIGAGDRTFVEIGCSDGRENCTRALAEDGWRGAWFDGDPERVADARRVADRLDLSVHEAIVTSANVNDLLRAAGVGPEPAVAVLDIDGSDLWVLRAMLRTIAPRLLVVEYNSTFPPGEFWTRRNRHRYTWPETYEHGASLDAMQWAASAAGYELVACDRLGVNAFFVRRDVARAAGLPSHPPEALYRPYFARPPIIGHPWWEPEPCPVLPPEAFDRISVTNARLVFDRIGPPPDRVRVVGVRADVVNPTSIRLTSDGPTPVSLSARLVDAGGRTLPHECERNALIGGVPAHSHAPVGALFRFAEPDVDRLRLTLVQDGVAWLDANPCDLTLR